MGIDPRWLLNADPVEREVAVRVLTEGVALASARDKRLAEMIILELAEAMKRK